MWPNLYVSLSCKRAQLNKDIGYSVRVGMKRREADDIPFFCLPTQRRISLGTKLRSVFSATKRGEMSPTNPNPAEPPCSISVFWAALFHFPQWLLQNFNTLSKHFINLFSANNLITETMRHENFQCSGCSLVIQIQCIHYWPRILSYYPHRQWSSSCLLPSITCPNPIIKSNFYFLSISWISPSLCISTILAPNLNFLLFGFNILAASLLVSQFSVSPSFHSYHI